MAGGVIMGGGLGSSFGRGGCIGIAIEGGLRQMLVFAKSLMYRDFSVLVVASTSATARKGPCLGSCQSMKYLAKVFVPRAYGGAKPGGPSIWSTFSE